METIHRRIKSSVVMDNEALTKTWCQKELPVPRTSGHWRAANCPDCEKQYNKYLLACQAEKNQRIKRRNKK